MSARRNFENVPGFVGPVRKDIKVHMPGFKTIDREAFSRHQLPILGLDPGGTTGWSLLVLPAKINGQDVFSHSPSTILKNRRIWEHGEIETLGCEDEAVYQISKIAGAWPTAAIVVEDFILRVERKEKSRELLSPVRITAKLETYLWRMQRKMFLQMPGTGKRIDDERLDLMHVKAEDGLPDHARDADRHAIQFMRRCIGPQGVANKRTAWPHIYAPEMEQVQ